MSDEEVDEFTVKMFMSTNPLTIDEDADVVEAARRMALRGVGACFIERDGKVVGIITERDIVRRVVARGLDASKIKVSEIMSTPIIAVEPDATVEDALIVMAEKKIRRLAVIEENQLVGIVTISDLAKALLKKVELINNFVKAATRKLPMYE
ncbi:MAG: CBS domain-containing protein [Aigarchaeota archaeon]|nr:CBS domain-containing protein [Aigarchaeota archaeon]MCX8192747.1 CBS domain-containing protein [Nitrososphaeria archaeon]MDW7985999.1 CBS domain-containing protein [Nitrososphaerota archaeon]